MRARAAGARAVSAASAAFAGAGRRTVESVALLNWAHHIEDVLDPLGVSLEAFRERYSAGWFFLFGEALQRLGVRATLFCASARVEAPLRFVHEPSGMGVWLLPSLRSYRAARRLLRNPYAATLFEAVGERPRGRAAPLRLLRQATPYLATPVAALARALRSEGCDTVLCQEYEHARFDLVVALGRLLRIPVFATYQGCRMELSRLERSLRPLSLRACAGLIIGSRAEIERVRTRYGTDARKIARIFNPVDAAVWSPLERAAARGGLGIEAERVVVVWHGRVELHRKGLDLLLDAWRDLSRARAARAPLLLLLGAGVDAAELQARIGAAPDVRFLNRYLDDRAAVRRYLAASDVFVLPSRHEGFPMAPLEAMACGLPVVAAAAPGVEDILEGGEASGGVVVPVGDASALGAALGRLIDDESLRAGLGARARARVLEHFSLEAMGPRLLSFLSGAPA